MTKKRHGFLLYAYHVSFPASHVRGGSVSRRGLNRAYRRPTALTGGTNYAKTYPAKRQPLFGREREGGASLREAASLAYPYVRPSLRERGSGGEALLFREAASPPEYPLLFHCLCEIVEGGFVELGAAEGDSWLNDGDFLHLGQHTLHGPHRRRAPRAVFDQAEGALLIVLDK